MHAFTVEWPLTPDNKTCTYLVGVLRLQEHGSQQTQADDLLLALVLADVTGERVVVLAVVEAGRQALQRLIAPFVLLREKT